MAGVTFRMSAEGGDTHSCAGEQEIRGVHDLTRLPRHLKGKTYKRVGEVK